MCPNSRPSWNRDRLKLYVFFCSSIHYRLSTNKRWDTSDIEDILREASPWLDQIFLGVWDGFRGTHDHKSVEELLGFAFECDLFFAANPDVTVRDVAKMKRLSGAVGELLDAAT